MTTRDGVVRGLLRALTMVGVLAGVLAMHALTTDHHAAMAGMASPVVTVTDGGGGSIRVPSGQSHSAAAPHAAPAMDLPQTSMIQLAVSASADRGASAVCLAVLAIGLLLVLIRLAARWFGSGRLVTRPRHYPSRFSSLAERSPPWSVLSLSKLCVLRI